MSQIRCDVVSVERTAFTIADPPARGLWLVGWWPSAPSGPEMPGGEGE